jgi:hypothetical protein
MTLSMDVGEIAEQALFAAQELAQFEPDPEGDGVQEAAGAGAEAADPQWVVFPDVAAEAAWAATGPLAWSPR